jgi:hypothetical protein
MRVNACSAALTGLVLLLSANSSRAAETTVACPVLTPAQIGAAIGGTVGVGAPIIVPTSCQWVGQQGKRVTLTINQPRGGKSPVEQFNAGKASKLPGITTEPVGGVGDDAFYVYFAGTTRAGCGLMVKKGSSAFEIRVYGFDLDQAKVVSKQLAKDAASKF